MGFEVNRATPRWPQQLAMSTGKNSDLGVRKEGETVIYSFISYLFTQHLHPTSCSEEGDPCLCHFYPSWEEVSTDLVHSEGDVRGVRL